MAEPLKLFVAAGEPSGDRIGADLVRSLRRRRSLRLGGVGGGELEGEGLISLFPMRDLSVMGFADVIARFPLLWLRMRQTVGAILRETPDVVVMIDSQVFAARVAAAARSGGYRGPILLYVAPSVWAWKPERARALNGLFDEVLAVLPFEPTTMRGLGGPLTTYVGHPAVDRIAPRPSIPERGPLLLLPGSRSGELRRHLPIMERVAVAFAAHPRVTKLVLPTPASQLSGVTAAVAGWASPVSVISGAAEVGAAFASAIAAAAVSGTITLELALAGIPMAVIYTADGGQYRHWLAAGRPQVSLPNIVAGKSIVPELVSPAPQAEFLIAEIRKLIEVPQAATVQLAGFQAMRKTIESGVTDAATRVLARIG
ncbi:MAG: lipid-A-disaccharide synthase [Devosia sp.]